MVVLHIVLVSLTDSYHWVVKTCTCDPPTTHAGSDIQLSAFISYQYIGELAHHHNLHCHSVITCQVTSYKTRRSVFWTKHRAIINDSFNPFWLHDSLAWTSLAAIVTYPSNGPGWPVTTYICLWETWPIWSRWLIEMTYISAFYCETRTLRAQRISCSILNVLTVDFTNDGGSQQSVAAVLAPAVLWCVICRQTCRKRRKKCR